MQVILRKSIVFDTVFLCSWIFEVVTDTHTHLEKWFLHSRTDVPEVHTLAVSAQETPLRCVINMGSSHHDCQIAATMQAVTHLSAGLK